MEAMQRNPDDTEPGAEKPPQKADADTEDHGQESCTEEEK